MSEQLFLEGSGSDSCENMSGTDLGSWFRERILNEKEKSKETIKK